MQCYSRTKVYSTQDEARSLLSASASRIPFSVCARMQLKGRGTSQRLWRHNPGNVACTIAYPLSRIQKVHATGLLTLITGLALRQYVAAHIPAIKAEKLRVKWPNDVMLEDKKIAGILTEIVSSSAKDNLTGEDIALIGMGVNIATTPEDVALSATSLQIQPPSPGAGFIAGFYPVLDRYCSMSRENINKLWAQWRYPADARAIYHNNECNIGPIEEDGSLILLNMSGIHCATVTDSRDVIYPALNIFKAADACY